MARELNTPEKMFIHLSTEARAENKENIEKTIYKMKSGFRTEGQVTRGRGGGVLKADLAQTNAVVLNSTTEDPRVAKLTQPGIQKMIAMRCDQLMPQWCFPCNGRLFYSRRGEDSLVTCRRCKRGACPACLDQNEVSKFFNSRNLCKECDDITQNDSGEGKLFKSDFDKTWDKKNLAKEERKEKEKKTPEEIEDNITIDLTQNTEKSKQKESTEEESEKESD